MLPCCFPSTRDASLMNPHDFAQQILCGRLKAVEVHEGYNFHFGHKAAGNFQVLAQLRTRIGIRTSAILRDAGTWSVGFQHAYSGTHSHWPGKPVPPLLGRPFGIISTPGRGLGVRFQVHRAHYQPKSVRRTRAGR